MGEYKMKSKNNLKKWTCLFSALVLTLGASAQAEWAELSTVCEVNYGHEDVEICLSNIQEAFDLSGDCDGPSVYAYSTTPELSTAGGCTLRRACGLVIQGASQGGSGAGCGGG